MLQQISQGIVSPLDPLNYPLVVYPKATLKIQAAVAVLVSTHPGYGSFQLAPTEGSLHNTIGRSPALDFIKFSVKNFENV